MCLSIQYVHFNAYVDQSCFLATSQIILHLNHLSRFAKAYNPWILFDAEVIFTSHRGQKKPLQASIKDSFMDCTALCQAHYKCAHCITLRQDFWVLGWSRVAAVVFVKPVFKSDMVSECENWIGAKKGRKKSCVPGVKTALLS